MITIIKEGKKKATINYKITCKHCNTVFTCAEHDLKVKLIGHGMTGNFITCPICYNELSLTYDFDCDWETF